MTPEIEKHHNQEQGHNHDHSRRHGHNHSHINTSSTRNIVLAFILNLGFSIIEFIYGTIFNSMAILSDAVHDLGDSISMGFALIFQLISQKKAKPNSKYTFGYSRFSLLGALVTGAILLYGSVLMIINSIPVLFNPQPTNTQGMFWLAIIAIAINGLAGWILSRGSSRNERMLNLHMLEDILGWIGVLIVSLVMRFTDFYILDPILAISISLFILSKAIPNFWGTFKILLNSSPENVDIEKIKNQILQLPGVKDISHLHIWSIDGEENSMTVTVLIEKSMQENQMTAVKRDIIKIANEINVKQHYTIELTKDERDLKKNIAMYTNA